MTALQILQTNKMIPVINIKDIDLAVPLARALLKGGVKILEITLRNENSLKIIKLLSEEIKEAIIGAGTIKSRSDLDLAIKAGARFAITPGLSQKLANDIKNAPIPIIPGIATPSELINAVDFGYNTLKLFPASVIGGIELLKSFCSPFSEVKFCPTGGIDFSNAKNYLDIENVLCVGSSALCPSNLISEKKFDEITALAEKSCEL